MKEEETKEEKKVENEKKMNDGLEEVGDKREGKN